MTMSDLNEYLKIAFDYKNNGDYKESIDYFYKALALDNESSEIMCELAFLYSKLCQYDRAISFYEQIMSKNPTNYSAKLQFALLLKSIKEYTRAEDVLSTLYEKAYELETVAKELFYICSLNNDFEKIILYFNKYSNQLNTSTVFYYVALAYSKIGRKDIAEKFYNKSFEVDNKNILSGTNVAKGLFEKGKIEEAESLALKLLTLSEDAEVFYLLAEIAYAKADIDASIKYYSYAIRVNSQNALYYFKLAIVFSLKGFFKEAEESYCRAIAIEPENTTYNYTLAYMYYMNKKFDLSEKLVDYVLTINPDDFQALSLKALLLINKNEVAHAANLIEEIDSQKDKDDFSYYVQAIYFSKLNLWEKSVESILNAIRLNETSIEYKYQLAKFYFNLSDSEKAIDICGQIIKLNSKYIQAYILLAKIYMEKSDFDNAKENINKALFLDKNLHEAYSILAEINFVSSEYDKAVDNYKIAASMNPNSEEYFAKIAQCYYLLENYKDAYSYFKEASEFDISNATYRYYMAKCSIYNNDSENAIANFSVMKRLAPANIAYIEEYADYIATCGNKKNAVAILESLIKNVANSEEKERLKKNIKKIKKGC